LQNIKHFKSRLLHIDTLLRTAKHISLERNTVTHWLTHTHTHTHTHARQLL